MNVCLFTSNVWLHASRWLSIADVWEQSGSHVRSNAWTCRPPHSIPPWQV